MDFSFSSLMSGFIFGVIGFYVVRHAKKDANIIAVVLGIALMIYPYFVSGDWLPWIVGIALCGATYYVW
jgi:multisubunit Na+/H+ antiporter MnhE subunit